MTFSLGQTARKAGYRLAAYEAVGSTNDAALEAARAGDVGPLWSVTDHQTGGRGRRGRSWQGPAGNLAASLLMKSSLPPHRLATLGFVAGLALIDALEICAPNGEGDRIALKWPNDLLADGCKFVGILLESESCADGTTAIVAGMGVNVAVAPIGTPYPSTCLADLGWKLYAQEVFSALSDAWVDRYAAWDQGHGMAAIRNDWLMHAAGVGGPVTVTVGTRQITGTFETLDSDGRLVIREPDGKRVPVSAGDVHFGAAATLPAAG